MEKAMRRSGIRLKSVKSGHSLLRLIVSDWKQSRKAYKSYISNQEMTWTDIINWAASEHNRGLGVVLDHVMQLQALWTDVQTQFLSALKKFQHQFESILESELQLDKSLTTLRSFEQKEKKIIKDLRKAGTRSYVDDLRQIEDKLRNVQISIQNAQVEVTSNTNENESIKMLLMKEGLINVSNHFIELADKTSVIFKAQRDVATTLPDAHSTNIQDIEYHGNVVCSEVVANVMKQIRTSNNPGQASAPSSSPPPYYPPSPTNNASFTSPSRTNLPHYYDLPLGSPSSLPSISTAPPLHCENLSRYYNFPPRDPECLGTHLSPAPFSSNPYSPN